MKIKLINILNKYKHFDSALTAMMNFVETVLV